MVLAMSTRRPAAVAALLLPGFLACLLFGSLAAPSELRGANATTSSPSSAAGAKCSASDLEAIHGAGPGNADGTWPKIIAECGRKAYSVWWGFNRGTFEECVQKDVMITDECVTCYADSGQYSAKNCKRCAFNCMFKWCSSWCLDCMGKCNAERDAELEACVGEKGPEPTTC
eukprot:TRINITY_DN15402_c0_g1_i1.p2 TRINITY_DN15402_c0_g1~~TRINITY_DN15402_c0_g1_i1.p2  ORF type:complete len:194 (-),score=37.53 TRINITY_DN15402_c0_g1_i1:407-922(-)